MMRFAPSGTTGKRVTVTAIAQRLGISQPVVSTVLGGGNGSTRVSADLSERIRSTATAMGYRPNAAARATATGRFNTVTLLLSTIGYRSILPTELLDGIIDALAEHDHRLTLAKFPDEKLVQDAFVPHVFRECMCDGLLINYNAQIPQAMLEHVAEAYLPTVWINSKQAHDCVYPDDLEAGRMAARVLLEAGHRHVAFANLTGWDHYSAPDRRDGIVEAMRAGGGTCEMLDTPTNRGIPAISAALACLRRPERPTAMVAYTKFEAMPLVEAAHQLGLRIPGDLSLLVFDSDPWDWSELGISALRLPERGLGEAAVAMLMRRIAQPTVTQQPKAVPFDLIVGATVGSPGGKGMKGNGMGVGVTTRNERSGDRAPARMHGWDRGLSSDIPET